LKHLGITAPNRSTLAYANEHRPWELYQKVFLQLLQRCQTQVQGKKKFRFKNKLVSLDSTTIDLSVTLFDWAKFRRTKGAIKLHLLLDHDGYLPTFAVVTEGKVADIKVVPEFSFAPGTIVADDRGYTDYELWGRWTAQGVYFVSRIKRNAVFEAVGERPVPQNRHILRDEAIELRGLKAQENCPYPLRVIEVYDPETEEIWVLITNHHDLGATTIAAIYKDRWQIEAFFRALKQNLKIKTFVGTSANAVKIQVWTALIAMLILRFLQLCSQFKWSLSNLVALLRMNLFTHRDLWAWLNEPFETPPVPYEPEQLPLALG
jgi:IS4 transposase